MPGAAARWACDALRGVVDLVYPPVCAVCHAAGDAAICPACRADFRPPPQPACLLCGGPILPGAGLCHACTASAPGRFAAVHAAGRYEGALRGAILALKYGRRRRLAAPLGEFLAEHLAGTLDAPGAWLLVPVPLHRSRLRERGFNQSELLAGAVAASLGGGVEGEALVRVRRTRPQASLPAHKRAANIANAFALRRPERVAGRRVLIVDDVVTTLSTVSECARVLTDGGAVEVRVAAVARGG